MFLSGVSKQHVAVLRVEPCIVAVCHAMEAIMQQGKQSTCCSMRKSILSISLIRSLAAPADHAQSRECFIGNRIYQGDENGCNLVPTSRIMALAFAWWYRLQPRHLHQLLHLRRSLPHSPHSCQCGALGSKFSERKVLSAGKPRKYVGTMLHNYVEPLVRYRFRCSLDGQTCKNISEEKGNGALVGQDPCMLAFM
jgi:hypothetical protein